MAENPNHLDILVHHNLCTHIFAVGKVANLKYKGKEQDFLAQPLAI